MFPVKDRLTTNMNGLNVNNVGEKASETVNGIHSQLKVSQKKFKNYVLEDFDISTVIGKIFNVLSLI